MRGDWHKETQQLITTMTTLLGFAEPTKVTGTAILTATAIDYHVKGFGTMGNPHHWAILL